MRDGESQAAWKESMDPRAGRGLRVGRPAWEASAVGTDRRGRVQALANLFRHWESDLRPRAREIEAGTIRLVRGGEDEASPIVGAF